MYRMYMLSFWTVSLREDSEVLDICSFLPMIDYIAVLFLQINFSYGNQVCLILDSGLCLRR
jgi:hypothetical protein